MLGTSFLVRTRVVMVAITLTALAVPVWAQDTCSICGGPLGSDAVVVTDWETNREHRYHDLRCAVQAMRTRFPWSQAATCSAQFKQRVALSRINTSWRAQPEGALVATLAGDAQCGQLVTFVSREELEAYWKAHPGATGEASEVMALQDMPKRIEAPNEGATSTESTAPRPVAPNATEGGSEQQASSRAPAPSKPGKPSLLGYSGLLAAPDARVLDNGAGVAVAGMANREFLGAAALGIGDNAEVAITSRGIEEQMQDTMGESRSTHSTILYGSAKQRLENFSRPGLDVAAGITGFGSRTALYVAGTREVQWHNSPLEATVGIGTGGVLDGLFAGIRAPLGGRLFSFAPSADLLIESVNAGAGRSMNFGLGLTLSQGLEVKLGAMDGKPTVGVGMGRSF